MILDTPSAIRQILKDLLISLDERIKNEDIIIDYRYNPSLKTDKRNKCRAAFCLPRTTSSINNVKISAEDLDLIIDYIKAKRMKDVFYSIAPMAIPDDCNCFQAKLKSPRTGLYLQGVYIQEPSDDEGEKRFYVIMYYLAAPKAE